MKSTPLITLLSLLSSLSAAAPASSASDPDFASQLAVTNGTAAPECVSGCGNPPPDYTVRGVRQMHTHTLHDLLLSSSLFSSPAPVLS